MRPNQSTTPDNHAGGAPDEKRDTRRRAGVGPWIVVIVVMALATVGVTALLINIFEHKQEARNPFFRVVELNDDTHDPAVWGKNFPHQFDSYRRTVDMQRTRFGGSEAEPRVPTEKDPREQVAFSRIVEDPRLKVMWAGYAFAKDFREERGHAFMLEDQSYTERVTDFKQPGTCVNCHASTYEAYKKLGDGNLQAGFEKLNAMPYAEARTHVSRSVACIDCHDSETMQLRITRPAFMKAIAIVKEIEGRPGYDVNRDATRQELRSYVCAQCHVEYYFAGQEKRLTYPWSKGLKADEILSYYAETGFKDWEHAQTGAPMLKAQHPEFEMWSQGTHARAGVSCADCHMPYVRVGALKVSDHHVRSPLLNIANACQTCHRAPESELLARAETIQNRTQFSINLALDALVELVRDIEAQAKAGASTAALEEARGWHRNASFLIDFVSAENSSGFHADQEAMRILTLALDYCRKGQNALKAFATKPALSAATQ